MLCLFPRPVKVAQHYDYKDCYHLRNLSYCETCFWDVSLSLPFPPMDLVILVACLIIQKLVWRKLTMLNWLIKMEPFTTIFFTDLAWILTGRTCSGLLGDYCKACVHSPTFFFISHGLQPVLEIK